MSAKSYAACIAVLGMVLSQGCYSGQSEGDETAGADFSVNGYSPFPNAPIRIYASKVANPTTQPPGADWDLVGTTTSNNSAFPSFGTTWSTWSAALNTSPVHWRLYNTSTQMYDANGVPAYVLRKGQRIHISGFIDVNNSGTFNEGVDSPILPFLADFNADHDGDGQKCIYHSGSPSTEYYDNDCYITDDVILTLTHPCGAVGQPSCSLEF